MLFRDIAGDANQSYRFSAVESEGRFAMRDPGDGSGFPRLFFDATDQWFIGLYDALLFIVKALGGLLIVEI